MNLEVAPTETCYLSIRIERRNTCDRASSRQANEGQHDELWSLFASLARFRGCHESRARAQEATEDLRLDKGKCTF